MGGVCQNKENKITAHASEEGSAWRVDVQRSRRGEDPGPSLRRRRGEGGAGRKEEAAARRREDGGSGSAGPSDGARRGLPKRGFDRRVYSGKKLTDVCSFDCFSGCRHANSDPSSDKEYQSSVEVFMSVRSSSPTPLLGTTTSSATAPPRCR